MQWKRPEEGWFKVNTDAAFVSNTCTGSAGVVIRDHLGRVQLAAARWYDDVTIEAMASKEGPELAAENGYDQVFPEVDWS